MQGDGLEFKRLFVHVKEKMSHLIWKDSYDWLERNGLLSAHHNQEEVGLVRPADQEDADGANKDNRIHISSLSIE